MPAVFQRCIGNSFPDLVVAAKDLNASLGAHDYSPDAVYSVNLAFEEMVTNIIKYAYDDSLPHSIVVSLEEAAAPRRLLLTISDDGRSFDPSGRADAPRTASLEDCQLGGLGIYIVKNMVDSFEYERAGERNVLRIGINL